METGQVYWVSSCTNYSTSDNQCLQWTNISSLTLPVIKETITSSLWISFVFVLVFMMLGRITKVLFAKMFGGKK